MPTTLEMFQKYHLAVFKYLRRMTASHELGEDLTQEVFLRVSRSLPDRLSQDGESPWIFTIARNVLLNRRRSISRKGGQTLIESAGPIPMPAGQHLSAILNEAIADLPDAEREAFLLREVGGLGYQEIAETCACSRMAVRSRIYRARIRLREALSPAGTVPEPSSSKETRHD